MLWNTSLKFILDMIDDRDNKIKNVLPQEDSLKNRSPRKLVILLETYIKHRQLLQDYVISKT